MHEGEGGMFANKGAPGKSPMPRVSVSLPTDVHSTLEQIAQEKKVSVAWVVREAVDKYLADKWPLFAATNRHEEHHGR
jgi:metal-responsive CopG/Arc/MetJ family transcriptional regulator